ncbi:MAG TPA: ATP-binding cassette domain-containing protein, partial [Thermomicrobiales bacterium]|nr:ATP-binding cassette domain-containing protein [Thermomicrobiales bacterium]
SVADANAVGLCMLPEDRRTEGIFPDLDVLENIVIGTEGKAGAGRSGVLRRGQEERRYERLRDTLRIRAQSPAQPIPTLSGGNQQKVLLGRALAGDNRILVLNEPTRGVDVGTKAEIHALIRRLARDGMAMLVSSSDIPEVAKVSDRCLVLAGGRIVGRLGPDEVNEANILASAVGAAGPAAA